MIYRELDQVNELYFIMHGSYDVGYEINRVSRYRIQFGDRTVIGGFNLANSARMAFKYRAHTYMRCYAIRSRAWQSLCKEFDQFTQ